MKTDKIETYQSLVAASLAGRHLVDHGIKLPSDWADWTDEVGRDHPALKAPPPAEPGRCARIEFDDGSCIMLGSVGWFVAPARF